jgi:YggT family protein
VALVFGIISTILLVFLILLFARFVVDWVMVLARSWRPTGIVAAGLEVVYLTTDPPLRAVRKVIPPLNLGSIRLDLGFGVDVQYVAPPSDALVPVRPEVTDRCH